MRDKKKRTVVDEIVETLCHGIFRGDYEVGQNMPPLRAMAQTFEVTLPTMQRVVARLEELGLVEARQGSGVRVLEPIERASPTAMAFWLDVLYEKPREAAQFVSSFVQVRRELGLSVLREIKAHGLSQEASARMEDALCAFEARIKEGMTPLEAAREDFAVMRTWLGVRPGKVAIFVILNMFEQLVTSSEAIQNAIYDHPERNAIGYRAVFEALKDETMGVDRFGSEVSALLSTFDMVSLARFEALIEVKKGDV